MTLREDDGNMGNPTSKNSRQCRCGHCDVCLRRHAYQRDYYIRKLKAKRQANRLGYRHHHVDNDPHGATVAEDCATLERQFPWLRD